MLGNNQTNVVEKIPGFAKYNAFRWLRDSGFEPISYALTNVTVGTSAQVRAGLLSYGKRYRGSPREDNVGILALTVQKPEPDLGFSYAPLVNPALQVTVHAIIILSLLGGLALLIASRSCSGRP